MPPSLVNIYQELHDDLGCKIPNNGYLVKWAKQGVLMLEHCTYCARASGNSHRGISDGLAYDAVIRAVNTDRPIVFLLWGVRADEKKALNNPKHLIWKHHIQVHRLRNFRGFFGCASISVRRMHFWRKTN